MEFAVVRHRGPGLVPGDSRLHALREGDLLPRIGTATAATGPEQGQEHALPRHPRRRGARRGAGGGVGEAGGRAARLGAWALLRICRVSPANAARPVMDEEGGMRKVDSLIPPSSFLLIS